MSKSYERNVTTVKLDLTFQTSAKRFSLQEQMTSTVRLAFIEFPAAQSAE